MDKGLIEEFHRLSDKCDKESSRLQKNGNTRVAARYSGQASAYQHCAERLSEHPRPREGELREALRPFADRIGELEEEAHEALQVGGYIPLDDDCAVEVPVPWLRRARALLEGRENG